MFSRARSASRELNKIEGSVIDGLLADAASVVESHADSILEANSLDLLRMDPSDPKYDRLMLTPQRIKDIADDMRAVAALKSPLGVTLAQWERPNGMTIRKVTVPFGVIGIIYEARPNVTFDVFSLCLKSGSACLLKGGSDASETNARVVELLRDAVAAHGLDPNVVTLLPSGHDATAALLGAVGYVDLIIPRGGKRLIDYVRDTSRVPVIETGAGVCHTYLHSSGRTDYARDIVFNAKTRRPSVCNTLDTLVIDRARLADLADVVAALAEKNVVVYADSEAYNSLHGVYPLLERADDADFGREWLDYKMSVKTVADIDEAIAFINERGSRHSEAIIAEDAAATERFEREVDAACVYANVSTAFTDGGQFGFGAEIGISTQKLHARGPMALPEITTYKYIITGSGQTRW